MALLTLGLQLLRGGATVFGTLQRDVRASAIRVGEINGPDQWSPGDVGILQNQEAKKVREIGNFIFYSPLQYDYEAGIEVRTLMTQKSRNKQRNMLLKKISPKEHYCPTISREQ